MFDKLVESTSQKNGRRTGRYFGVTMLVYVIVLGVIAVGTVMTFSPALAEGNYLLAITPPPPTKTTPPPVQIQRLAPQPQPVFAAPARPLAIPPPDTVTSRPQLIRTGGDPSSYVSVPGNVGGPGAPDGRGELTPPPAPPPALKPPTPTPAPERPQTKKVSEGVLQGSAIRKDRPAYPPIARAVRASGAVQVQILISETGQVIEATAVSGHPLLRSAAIESAKKWVFTPTRLSDVPVKVQGILTFNFILE
jgi:TonB family protein